MAGHFMCSIILYFFIDIFEIILSAFMERDFFRKGQLDDTNSLRLDSFAILNFDLRITVSFYFHLRFVRNADSSLVKRTSVYGAHELPGADVNLFRR